MVSENYFQQKLGNKKIKFMIFGRPSEYLFTNFVHYTPYVTIQHLNQLLEQYRPHVFLDLSLWPETWSYTLTLALQTRIPIFSLMKPFPSVIQERAKKVSPDTFRTFSNVSELRDLLLELVHNPPRDLFLIPPFLRYSRRWTHLLLS